MYNEAVMKRPLLLASLWVCLSCTPIHPPDLSAAPPKPPLTQELLFHLLAGEMAGLQGDLMEAARHYLKAAQLSEDPEVAKRATRIALFAGDADRALEAAKRWAQLSPQDPEVHEVLALILLKQGNTRQALASLEKFLSSSPKPPLERFMAIAVLLKGVEKDRALKAMEALARRHPSPEAFFAYASLALEAGRLDEALEAADKALAQKPDLIQALVLKAQALSLKDKAKALAFLEKAIGAHPKAKALRLAYAQLLIDAGALEKALGQLDAVLAEDPADAEALYVKGLIAFQLERLEEAQQAFARLLELGEKRHEAHYYLGRIAEAEKRYAEALAWYEKVKGGPYRWDAELRIAVVMAKLGRLKEARERLHALPAPQPQQAIQKALAEGEMLREACRLEEAMGVYDRALQRFPDHIDLLYARSLLAERLGRIPEAERDLRRILAIDPDNPQALNALGYTLTVHTHRYREALGYIEKALKLRPEDPYILDSMGWVLYKLGHPRRALDYLHRALAKKFDAEVAAHLVEVLWKLGRREEAKALWQRAWKRHPDHPLLKEVKARCFP